MFLSHTPTTSVFDWLLDFDNSGTLLPYFERQENTNVLDVFVELPGSNKNDIDIIPVDHGISIKAKQTLGKSIKEVKKSFSVSKKYDLTTTEAEYKDGILKVTIKPRAAPAAKSGRIEIK